MALVDILIVKTLINTAPIAGVNSPPNDRVLAAGHLDYLGNRGQLVQLGTGEPQGAALELRRFHARPDTTAPSARSSGSGP